MVYLPRDILPQVERALFCASTSKHKGRPLLEDFLHDVSIVSREGGGGPRGPALQALAVSHTGAGARLASFRPARAADGLSSFRPSARSPSSCACPAPPITSRYDTRGAARGGRPYGDKESKPRAIITERYRTSAAPPPQKPKGARPAGHARYVPRLVFFLKGGFFPPPRPRPKAPLRTTAPAPGQRGPLLSPPPPREKGPLFSPPPPPPPGPPFFRRPSSEGPSPEC